jgi:hypothetical protein
MFFNVDRGLTLRGLRERVRTLQATEPSEAFADAARAEMESSIASLRRSMATQLYGEGYRTSYEGTWTEPPPRDLAADVITLRRAIRAAMLDGRLPRAGYNVHRARDGIRLRVERVPFAVLDPQKHMLLAGWRTAPGWSTRYMLKPRTRSGPFTPKGRELLTSITTIMRETRVFVTVDTQDHARLVRTLAAPCGHDDCFEHEALERACRAAK